jgi:hypothetical protein
MPFADEPAERAPSRQITRLQRDDPLGSATTAKGDSTGRSTASPATIPTRDPRHE